MWTKKKKKAGITLDVFKSYRIKGCFYRNKDIRKVKSGTQDKALADPGELQIVFPVYFYFNIQFLTK